MAPIFEEFTKLQKNIKLPVSVPTYSELMAGYRKIYFINNPGLLVNINKKTQDLYPFCFGGLNLNGNSDIGQYAYSINGHIGNSPKSYRAYSQFIGRETRVISNNIGIIDIHVVHDFSKELQGTIHTCMKKMGVINLNCILDYYGKDFTSSFSIGNHAQNKTEISLHLLQKVNKKVAIGGEIALQSGTSNAIEGGRVIVAGKQKDIIDGVDISGAIGNTGMQVCLTHKINLSNPDQLSIGSTLDYNSKENRFTGSLACRWTHEDITLKASIDTHGTLGVNLLKNVYVDNDANLNVYLSAITNKLNGFKFGIGVDVTL